MIAFALATVATVLAAAPQHTSDDKTLIYVDDVQTQDKALSADASALTTALCASLSKETRVDVMCAPDVKQILNFAATAAMVGTESSRGPGGAVQDRLEKTKDVVSSTFKKDGGKYVLVVKAGPKAADAQAASLYSAKPVIAIEAKGDTQKQILDQLNSVAAKVNTALLAPNAAAATNAPPAPLGSDAKKPTKQASGGW